jgi:predicted secreted protein
MCESQTYHILISDEFHNRKLELPHFPELNIIYAKSENHLCPSFYSHVMCVWEGNLILKLQVNDREITLNDHDGPHESSLETDKYKYSFQGVGPLVKNRSRDETYLIISVKRCPLRKIKTYRLGEPFTVRLYENVTTGYHWEVEVTPGLEIVRTEYETDCKDDQTGCGGHRTWTLKGIEKGEQKFTGRYLRPWEKEVIEPEILTFQID